MSDIEPGTLQSKLDTIGTDESVPNSEVSSNQGLVSTQNCLKHESCLWSCPQFRGVLIDEFHTLL